LPGALAEEQRSSREELHIRVDREVVRQLDVQHRERQKQASQMRGSQAEDTSGQ
jgi:hypothetical protein